MKYPKGKGMVPEVFFITGVMFLMCYGSAIHRFFVILHTFITGDA